MDPPMLLRVRDYSVTIRPRIGKGAFGSVYKAEHVRNKHQLYAAKEIELSDFEGHNPQLAQMAAKETDMLMKLQRHRNILKVVEHFTRGDALWIITDFCDQGDLKRFLSENEGLSRFKQVDLMYQSSDGLAFMHAQNPPIVHRDIKLQNILVKTEDGKNVIKICDFGFARFYDEKVGSTFSAAFKERQRMDSLKGTAPFMAPEFSAELDGGLDYDASVDVFAMGLVFHVILEPNKPDFYPLSVESKRANRFVNIGYEMVHCHREKKDMPNVVEIKPDDDGTTKRLKRIIKNMTQFRSVKRKDIDDVKEELSEILESVQTSDIENRSADEGAMASLASLNITKEPSVSRKAVELSLSTLCNDVWHRQEMINLADGTARALRVVHGELWQCMGSNGITIYNAANQEQRRIPFTKVYDVAALLNGDVVIASGNGIFQCSIDGTKKCTVKEGRVFSVTSAGNAVYFCHCSQNSIEMYTYDGTWTENVIIPCESEFAYHLYVKNRVLYVAGSDSRKISKVVLNTNADIHSRVIPSPELRRPVMCQVDDDGCILVADMENDRLQVRDAAGQWHVVKVEPPLMRPRGAVMHNGKLYVTSFTEKTLSVYTPSKS